MDGSEAGTSSAHRAPGHGEPFQLFRGDPFDRRSALELFSSSAVPFAPLLFIVEMEDKVRDVLQFFT